MENNRWTTWPIWKWYEGGKCHEQLTYDDSEDPDVTYEKTREIYIDGASNVSFATPLASNVIDHAKTRKKPNSRVLLSTIVRDYHRDDSGHANSSKKIVYIDSIKLMRSKRTKKLPKILKYHQKEIQNQRMVPRRIH